MECEDLSLISKNERESKEITSLPITFYKDAKKYLGKLEEEIEKCNSPISVEYRMLSDELNTSIGRIEEIFFLRRSKIFSMAAQSHLSNIKHKNYNRLLPEEKKMYDALTNLGENLKSVLLDPVLNQEEEQKPELEEDKQECVLVRILKDIPTFAGVDGRSYTVKAEDTLLLPVSNAQGLIKKNVAQLIEN
ncbi:MAG: hypothetical protein PHX50_15210 [Massilibacteroides sp.]|nr:hypothetical protein [Massilibacteroides sp.]